MSRDDSVEQLEIRGLRIAVERSGSGPGVLFVHGGGSDRREWRPQVEGLRDSFTTVAWDAPGCGRSDDPAESFRMPDYADCLAEVVARLGLGCPHVVGLSFGGTLALELYRRHGDLPRSLVLVSAYAGWAGSLPADALRERLEGTLRESALPPRELAQRWLPGLLTEHAPPEVVAELRVVMSDVHPAGMRTMARAMAEADLRDVLPRIRVPTLLVHGEEDRRLPRSVAEELASQIPGARLVVVPGAGHLLNLEAAERLNAELREFFYVSSR
jgi:pimeloyl-ACP methyl ester carboxylesterase